VLVIVLRSGLVIDFWVLAIVDVARLLEFMNASCALSATIGLPAIATFLVTQIGDTLD
jgi:hypothetical protein